MNKIKIFLHNLFFPKKCLGCGKSDTYLCPDCFRQISLNCQPEIYLGWIISATNYVDPLIRKLIKSFKYHFAQELSEPLSQLLIRLLEQNFQFLISNSQFIIIPIPLHKHKLRYRGFNQAELLGQKIAEHFNLPIKTDILKRTIPTSPQVNIKNNEKRKENIKNAFAINPKQSVEGKTIILIDDVATTGATLIEASKILKQNGTKQVWALVVAKG